MILATAENVLQGRGLVDYTGTALTQFPPLYSLILALGSLLFRQDVFVVGWVLNVLVFGALIWFSGVYLYDTFGDEPLFAYFGSFVVMSSTSPDPDLGQHRLGPIVHADGAVLSS